MVDGLYTDTLHTTWIKHTAIKMTLATLIFKIDNLVQNLV